MKRRTAAFVDRCLDVRDAGEPGDEILGAGPRELIAIAALSTRGAVDIAADHIRNAYDLGMTRRQVLEAICCVIPMTGSLSATHGLRAMQLADAEPGNGPGLSA